MNKALRPAVGIIFLGLLVFVSSSAAETGAGTGFVERPGLLFDANVKPQNGQISGWHQSMGAAVVDARLVTLDLSALHEIKIGGAPERMRQKREILVGQSVDVVLPGQSRPMTL